MTGAYIVVGLVLLTTFISDYTDFHMRNRLKHYKIKGGKAGRTRRKPRRK